MEYSRSPRNRDYDSMLSEVLSFGDQLGQRDSPRHTIISSEASISFDVQEALLPKPSVVYEHPIPRWKRHYMVALFTITAGLLYADQNVLAPNLTAAAKDFGFNDAEKDQMLAGYVMAAFFVVGAPAALLVGWLTAKVNRRMLLFAVVMLGQAPCLLTYWVTHYWQFFALRMLTGVSVGGSFPLVYSLLGDLVPPTARSTVSAAVAIANGVGIAAGQGLASIVGPATNWRLPFVLVAIPAVTTAAVMLLTTSDPPRGAFEEGLQEGLGEGQLYEEVISWTKTKVLLKQPSNWIIILQGLPGCLPWGMMLTFFNDYLSYDRGLSIQLATLVVLLFGLGGGAGTIAGGALGQYLYNHRKGLLPLLMGAGVLLGIAPLYLLINTDIAVQGVGFAACMAILAGFVASIPVPNLRAIILNVNEPELRGIAVALQSMTDDVGKGLGPFVVASFISVLGRREAFNVAVAGWVPCAALMFGLSCCMVSDEQKMQQRLQQAMERRQSRAGAASSLAAGLRFEEDVDGPRVPVSSSALDGRMSGGKRSSRNGMLAVHFSSSSSGGGRRPAPAGQELLLVPVRTSAKAGPVAGLPSTAAAAMAPGADGRSSLANGSPRQAKLASKAVGDVWGLVDSELAAGSRGSSEGSGKQQIPAVP